MPACPGGVLCFLAPCECPDGLASTAAEPGTTAPSENPMGGLFSCRPDSWLCLNVNPFKLSFPRFENRRDRPPTPSTSTVVGRTVTGAVSDLAASLTGPILLLVVGLIVALVVIRRVA